MGSEDMTSEFTDALMAMISEYLLNHKMREGVGGPEMERVDENRFVYKFADVEMSITVNRIDRVLPDHEDHEPITPEEVTL